MHRGTAPPLRAWFKKIIFSKYATNLKTIISHRRFAHNITFLILHFLIDIIDNIITYSLYSPHYVTRTLANGRAVCWSRKSRDQYAALPLAKVLVALCGLYGLDEIIFSIISIENVNKNLKILRLLWDILVFGFWLRIC